MPDRPVVQARRALLTGSLAALLAPSLTLAQPPRVARLGLLASSTAENFAASIKIFRKSLQELGWVEGQNLAIEARYAGVRYDQLPALAAELVKLEVDVILALATPAIQAAKRATTTIPIVFETLGDAVSTGLVTNLARPGGNVTGWSGFAPELSGKRLELIRELLPGAARVALLANRTNASTAVVLQKTEAAAQQLRMQLLVADVQAPTGLDPAFEAIVRERSEAFVVAPDPTLFSLRRRIVELAARHRLPAVYEYRLFTELGGLLSYGPDSNERFRRNAVYVDRILRGARPGDLPVEQPSTFELVLNLLTASRLRLTIPPSVRLRADHVID
jgi:putative tryptophan/tyrosine transport system substrate-binding protein